MNKNKLVEFLTDNKNYVLDYSKLKLRLTSKNKIRISSGRKSFISDDINYIMDFAEKHSNGFRICNRCGKPCEEIMMNEDGFYSCEECFEDYMDEIYGAGNWLQVDEMMVIMDIIFPKIIIITGLVLEFFIRILFSFYIYTRIKRVVI